MLPNISGLAQQSIISYSYYSLMQASPFVFGDLGTRTFHSVAVDLEHPDSKVPAEGQKETGKYCAWASTYGPNLEVFYFTYVYILLVRIQSDGLQSNCKKDLEGQISLCPKREWSEYILSLTEHLGYQSILFYFCT